MNTMHSLQVVEHSCNALDHDAVLSLWNDGAR